ncbi:hypothetical protein LCGC14_1179960 [marine sediment metagenome]|uniref:Uncharacterized protein n=1 Tax=marine sediment metagenome TaxID=412755 RepID=A0A0F9LMH1_9ZZZZ
MNDIQTTVVKAGETIVVSLAGPLTTARVERDTTIAEIVEQAERDGYRFVCVAA